MGDAAVAVGISSDLAPSFEALKAALDGRGLREEALKEALAAECLSWSRRCRPRRRRRRRSTVAEGRAKVGERLLLQIDSDRGELTSLATVVGYLPEEGDDFAMWRVAHDDGDEQDLVTPAIEAYNARDADGLMVCDGRSAWRNSARPTRRASRQVAEEEEPPPPGSLLGAAALRNEILVLADGLAGGLKAGSAWVAPTPATRATTARRRPSPSPSPSPRGREGKGDDESAATTTTPRARRAEEGQEGGGRR